MATVYRGFDSRLQVHRAIKVLAEEYANRPKVRAPRSVAHCSRAAKQAAPTALRSAVWCCFSNPLLTSNSIPPPPTSTGATMAMPLERRSRRRRLRAVDVISIFI